MGRALTVLTRNVIIDRPAGTICRALFVVMAVLAIAGCSSDAKPPATTVPTLTPGAATIVVRTLPPTWTPSFTPTPLPPSPTPTATLTPTPQPTLDPLTVCEDLEIISVPEDGVGVDYSGRVAFSWRGAPASVTVRVVVWQRASGEGILVEWPSEQALNMPIEMSYLPDAGIYDWTFSLYHPILGDLCKLDGWFERRTVAESSTPTPTITPPVTPATTGVP